MINSCNSTFSSVALVFILGRWFAENILNKANASNTEAAFLDINSSSHINDTVSTKTYDKRDDFVFDFFRTLMAISLGVTGVYISQLICFARAC